MKKKLKIGVVGFGKMGSLHSGLFNILPNSQVIAVSETNKLLIRGLKSFLPHFNVYTDYNKMIKKENLDAICITTPVNVHMDIIETAIENRIPFFVEKPVTKNYDETKKILQKLINNYIINQVGYCRRFIDSYNFAKKIIQEKNLGELRYYNSYLRVSQIINNSGKGWQYDPLVSGGGALIDLGSHAIDLLHYMIGDITDSYFNLFNIYNEKVEDIVLGSLKHNKVIGSIEVNWSIRHYRQPECKIHLEFEKGCIDVTEKFIKIFSEETSGEIKKGFTNYYQQDIRKDIPFNLAGPEYTREDMHFIDSIMNCRRTICDVEESSHVQKIIQRAYSKISGEV